MVRIEVGACANRQKYLFYMQRHVGLCELARDGFSGILL